MRCRHPDPIRRRAARLLLLPRTGETLVQLMSVGPSRGWTNTARRMLRLAGLLRIPKHALQQRSSILLATSIGLLEAKRPIRAVEALIDAV